MKVEYIHFYLPKIMRDVVEDIRTKGGKEVSDYEYFIDVKKDVVIFLLCVVDEDEN